MSKQAILELLDSNEAKCRKTQSRKAKGVLLAQLVELTGYKSSRNIIRYYAKKKRPPLPEKRGRMAKLHPQDIQIRKLLWLKSNQPCGKRLHSMLPTWLHSLSKRYEIDESSMVRILDVSPATLDRALSRFKVDDSQLHHRQSISALKQSIPIINATRKVTTPGHLYADTVAHCGESTRGSFVWTLTVTDELTLWTNHRAIWNKGQEATGTAFLYLLREMPFMIYSINTDNGSEFINYHLQRLLKEKHKRCKLTRSGPYKKNDNARAEERNRHKVREPIGYERIDEPECVYLLNQVYRYHNLLTNFFVAGTRLVSKEKNPATGKTHKKYDRARTPYERVLEHMKEGRRKQKLIKQRRELDPINLQEKIEKSLRRLFEHLTLEGKK